MNEKLRSVVVRNLWRVPPRVLRGLPSRFKDIRLMRAYESSLYEHPRTFVARMRNGHVFLGNTRDVIQRNVYTFGVWEPEITHWLEGFLRPGDLVVDVGANTGYFSLEASKLVGPEGLVVAVEPVPSISAALVRNITANNCTNVHHFNVVASDLPGAVEIYRATDENIGNSSTVPEPGHASEGLIEAVRLDDLLADLAGPAVRVVKIDTEGDEAKVLAGMPRTLESMPSGSAVLVEVTPEKLALRGSNEHDVWRFFPELDWLPHRINNDYLLESYLATPKPPEAIDGPLGERADLIFVRR